MIKELLNGLTVKNCLSVFLRGELKWDYQKMPNRKLLLNSGQTTKDSGSTEVQIALLTKRIVELTEHFKIHKKDHNSRRGLLKLVGSRRKLLKYLKRNNLESYRSLIKELGLRK